MEKASDRVNLRERMAERASLGYSGSAAGLVEGLKTTFDAVRDLKLSGAIFNHFPIALVTSIEVFFRRTACELIDHGSPFLDRAEPLFKEIKFDFHAICALQGRRVSLGEIVGLGHNFQSLGAIAKVMNCLSESDFLATLATVKDRWEVEILKTHNDPIIADLDSVMRTIARLFEVRNIVTHEIPRQLPFEVDEIPAFIESTKLFLRASTQYGANLIDPNAPLQQQPMNVAAGQKAGAAHEEMMVIFETLKSISREDRKEDLDNAQAAWVRYAEATATYDGNDYRGGSLRPTIHNRSLERLTRQRIDDLKYEIETVKASPYMPQTPPRK